ncbi:hypothetical protein VTO42DRAFT_2741 [Malbranchea cinnamomea]
MRRAAVHAFRTARRLPLRNLPGRTSTSLFSGNHALVLRSTSLARSGTAIRPAVLQSSLLFRNFALAIISTLVASGAWIAYNENRPEASNATATAVALNSSSPVSLTQGIALDGIRPTGDKEQAFALEAENSPTQALVVQADQLFASASLDQPLSKSTDDSGKKKVGMLTPEEATRKLRKNEQSYLVGRGRGVVRYDLVQLPSNDPIEDDHAEKIVEVPSSVAATEDGSPSSDWMFWGVFDGHSGWTTSSKLRQALIPFVTRELNATYQAALSSRSVYPAPEAVDSAIKQGFLRLDHEIVHASVEKVLKENSKRVAAELLAPALSGSCALLAFYDTNSRILRVACTGDSRAVLGRRAANGKWTATPLSEDQTGSTESEARRLRQEHPGEPHVVRDGRVLGRLEPTRAFGDAFYKWQRDVQDQIKRHFLGRSPHPSLKTPPYVTAEPVITRTQIDPSKGDFVVLATDGLWEMLTNEEVVGLVGQWLEQQQSGQGRSGVKGWLQNWFGSENELPVEKSVQQDDPSGQRQPIRQKQYQLPANTNRFVVEDKNAATHLVRNALGGKDKDMVCALLTLPSPYSRRYRDDLTVQVIFFGEEPGTGGVTMNPEATASAGTAQPKL